MIDDFELYNQDWDEFIRKGRESYELEATEQMGCVRVHEESIHEHGRHTQPPRSMYATDWR